jgi:hypothetical protein
MFLTGQFVAMKIGHGHTIEEPLSKTAIGGIQIDVFPSLVGVTKFRQDPAQHLEVALDKSPQDLNIKPKEQITMTSRQVFFFRHHNQSLMRTPYSEMKTLRKTLKPGVEGLNKI